MNVMSSSTLDLDMLIVTMDFNPEDKLLWEKFATVLAFIPRINAYLAEGLDESHLIRPLAMKKIAQIKAAISKKELDEIMARPNVRYHYDGSYRPVSQYTLPEEELIGWMATTLRAPLPDAAYRRYFEVFAQVFPEHADIVNL